ncbi:MAG TPA: trypsin-like peptidase domain-containing protein [Casimicrobiaceae bacterium]|nr:trypsin-like peptidase domain-containing protein [Casimicrobiaceae bacterium]
MLLRIWLVFAQACTLCLAALFVVSTLRPDLLPHQAERVGNVVLTQETKTPVATAKVASYADAAKKAMPAVVNIVTSKDVRARSLLADDPLFRRYFPNLDRGSIQRQTSLGSGVIVSPEGFVITNNHVIEGADDIQLVLSDGRRFKAQVRGTDPESDIAVLKADAENLPAITLGHAEDLQVGDVVLAIGNPYGFGSTVTAGIVSALGRNALGLNLFEDFIQTDAAINPGNSGGALIDTAGNLIGINSMIFSQSGASNGIAFSIPVSLARSVFEQIIRDGEVTRGWLGIEPVPLTPELAKALALPTAEGVAIRSVQRGTPADRAGIMVKDVFLDIGGKPTRTVPQLMARIAELAPGSAARVHLVRDGKPLEVEVVVGKRPRPAEQ